MLALLLFGPASAYIQPVYTYCRYHDPVNNVAVYSQVFVHERSRISNWRDAFMAAQPAVIPQPGAPAGAPSVGCKDSGSLYSARRLFSTDQFADQLHGIKVTTGDWKPLT